MSPRACDQNSTAADIWLAFGPPKCYNHNSSITNCFYVVVRRKVEKTKKIIPLNLVLLLIITPSAAALVPNAYVPDEIIIKFRAPVANTLEQQLQRNGSSGRLTLSPDLDALNAKYKVTDVKPLLKNFRKNRQQLKALQAKSKSLLTEKQRHILARLKRAPKNAKVPDLAGIYKIQLDLEPDQSLHEVLEAYQRNPDVEYAELNYIVSICTEPNDPLYPIQWPLHNIGQMYPESGKYNHPPGTPDADIDAPAAWDIHTGSSDVIVAVIDTGVDYNHRDLAANIWTDANGRPGYDFLNDDNDPMDDNGHGTHCAGIIAAQGDNDLDIVGVCWNARIMAVKFLGANGTGGMADAIQAVYYAVQNGADVISNSWAGFSFSHFKALEEAFEYAHSQGVVSVAAAGNNASTELLLPAFFDHVISVAATDSDDQKAILSNYGSKVDIAAPGVDILSLRAAGTSKGTTYNAYTTILSGTSMACPHVAGAFALLFSFSPDIDIDQAADIILQTTDHLSGDVCASGRLNLYRAILAVADFYAGKISFDSDIYSCSDTIELFLSDLSLAGNVAQDVNVITSGGDLETVTLTEVNSPSGTFTGTISTDSGDPIIQDGTLQLAHRQFIVATYQDKDDGTGNPATATDTARTDCRAPVVFNVQIDVPGPEPTVTFDTNEPTTASVLVALACGQPHIIERTDSRFATSHTIELTGVSPYTEYFFAILALDIVANQEIDDNAGRCYAFTTTGPCHMYVPAQYSTIQHAINEAWDGSVVWVADGTYTGEGNRDIDFMARAITVTSENGPDNCIIDCRGSITEPHYGFGFYRAEDEASVLAGFTITNGYVTAYSYGGAIACGQSSPTITNCIMTANTAVYGGAIQCRDSSPIVTNCILSANRAGRGGAIACRKGAPIIISSTFSDNYADSAAGAIYCWRSTETIKNCIIWNNSAPQDPQLRAGPSPAYSCIQSWTGAGEGNIDADPCFVSPGCWTDANDPNVPAEPNDPNAVWIHGDYHLLPASPCIDAADPNYPYDPNQTDIDDQPRLFDGRLDMGADEFIPLMQVPMKLTPQSLNPASEGNWLKAHFVLPQGFTVDHVDTNTPALVEFRIESQYMNVFINEDGLVEIVAAFDRADFCNAFPYYGPAELTVVGLLTTGQYFAGTHTIKIVNNTLKYLADLASHWLRTDCRPPHWCDDLDLDQNSVVNLVDFALLDTCCIEVITK